MSQSPAYFRVVVSIGGATITSHSSPCEQEYVHRFDDPVLFTAAPEVGEGPAPMALLGYVLHPIVMPVEELERQLRERRSMIAPSPANPPSTG